jgi:hypothetical protein
MALGHGPKVVTDGLVLALDAADRNSYPGSGTTWTDLSGNGRTGTLVNGVGYNSSNRGYLSFDGGNDYVQINANASQLGIYDAPYTMSAFFRYFGKCMIFGTTVRATRQGLHHGVNGNLLFFGNYGESWVQGGVVSQNVWYHGTWVWSSTAPNTRVYRNGVLVASGNTNSFIGTQNISLGRIWDQNLNGNIAQVSIYNRALTASEIQQNFQALRGGFGI